MKASAFDIPRYLGVLPLFQEMNEPELRRLAAGCRLRNFMRGDSVFRVDQPCDEFHVTVTGQVKLFALSPDGQEKVIELVGPGVSFAEALMFTGTPYIINAEALADTLLLSVGKAVVVAEIERDPRFALRMLAGISRRLHGLVHDVQAYALNSGRERVISYLLNNLPEESADAAALAAAGGRCAMTVTPRVSLPVSKATLASRLSLTPEYFSRVLRDLEDEGLVRIQQREIHILDADGLTRNLRRSPLSIDELAAEPRRRRMQRGGGGSAIPG